jgi:sulfur carrier protein
MKVNGKSISIAELKTNQISSLLEYFQLKKGTLAIEINGDILAKEEWDQRLLKEEDKIELIKFVGGG